MKKLLITLLLISPFSFADWGDVYYCQETSFVSTGVSGEVIEGELSKFQFKLDQTKNAMVFGSSYYLADKVLELRKSKTYAGMESWFAEDSTQRARFREGKLLYTLTGFSNLFAMSADCEKF